ncbi:hypothetical protein JB92DRAFT_3130029 [Gautieria morchelliformis]|nr:hypothetical protein JB92DRAFT_3130029 [Gautieria morchelliformis]
MASSLPKPTHPYYSKDGISHGAQGPLISVSAVWGIIIGLLIFGGAFTAMFYFIRRARASRISRAAAAIDIELTAPQTVPQTHVVMPPAPVEDASTPSYPEVENDQPPKYSTGQPPPFSAAVSV